MTVSSLLLSELLSDTGFDESLPLPSSSKDLPGAKGKKYKDLVPELAKIRARFEQSIDLAFLQQADISLSQAFNFEKVEKAHHKKRRGIEESIKALRTGTAECFQDFSLA